MSKIIDQMIVVDPTKRIDAGYVLNKSLDVMEQLRKSPKIDCVLVQFLF